MDYTAVREQSNPTLDISSYSPISLIFCALPGTGVYSQGLPFKKIPTRYSLDIFWATLVTTLQWLKFIQLLESPIPAAAAASSQKASSDDISGTKRGTVDPLVSKRPETNSEKEN